MKKRIISIGERFNKLTVIEKLEDTYSKSGRKYENFLCKCDCGNTTVVRKDSLIRGGVKSCGCLQRNREAKNTCELVKIGDVFGELRVIAYLNNAQSPTSKNRTYRKVLCECSCGNLKEITLDSLLSGATKSCGCLRKKVTSERMCKLNTYEICGDTTKVFDDFGNFTIIDTEDLEKIKGMYFSKGKDGYWVRGKQPRNLHRYITNCPPNMVVDHINHNRADNRKNNLKICTQQDNRKNMPFIGVVFLEHVNKWQASIKVDGCIKYLGLYNNFEDAVIAFKNGGGSSER